MVQLPGSLPGVSILAKSDEQRRSLVLLQDTVKASDRQLIQAKCLRYNAASGLDLK